MLLGQSAAREEKNNAIAEKAEFLEANFPVSRKINFDLFGWRWIIYADIKSIDLEVYMFFQENRGMMGKFGR